MQLGAAPGPAHIQGSGGLPGSAAPAEGIRSHLLPGGRQGDRTQTAGAGRVRAEPRHVAHTGGGVEPLRRGQALPGAQLPHGGRGVAVRQQEAAIRAQGEAFRPVSLQPFQNFHEGLDIVRGSPLPLGMNLTRKGVNVRAPLRVAGRGRGPPDDAAFETIIPGAVLARIALVTPLLARFSMNAPTGAGRWGWSRAPSALPFSGGRLVTPCAFGVLLRVPSPP